MSRLTWLASLLALVSTSLAGCATDSTAPGVNTPPPVFGQPLSVSQFDSTLASGPARIEIKLLPGGLVAREDHVEPDDAEEKLVSGVTAINTAAGTITLALGGMTVSYGAGTRFRTPSNSRVTRVEWESVITDAIGHGQQPPIEARRNPGAIPQAPTDPSFAAMDLRLASQSDEPSIEAYVDSDNIEIVAAPPPVAILRVFNLPVQITNSTQLARIIPGGGIPTGAIQFEAIVTDVDQTAGTLTFADGTVVQVGGLTFDPTGDLFSLSSAASAVSNGSVVRAEGLGSVTSAGPPAVITATAIKVEVDN